MLSKKKSIINNIFVIFQFLLIIILIFSVLIIDGNWDSIIKYSLILLVIFSFLVLLFRFLIKKNIEDDWHFMWLSFSIYFIFWIIYYPYNYRLINYDLNEIFSIINLFQLVNLTALLIIFLLRKADVRQIYIIISIYYFFVKIHYFLWKIRSAEALISAGIPLILLFIPLIIFLLGIRMTKKFRGRVLNLFLFIGLNFVLLNYSMFLYHANIMYTAKIKIKNYFNEYLIGLGVIFYIILIFAVEIIENKRKSPVVARQ